MINTEVYMDFTSVIHLKYTESTRDTNVNYMGSTLKTPKILGLSTDYTE